MAKKKESNPNYGPGRTDPASWYKPGCKPGPGRPKGSKNKATMLREASDVKVELRKTDKNGKPIKMSKQELRYHQLATKAANGDVKAVKMIEELEDRHCPPDPAPPSGPESAADLKTLAYYIDFSQRLTANSGFAGESNDE